MGQPPSDDLRVPTTELEDTEAAADGFHYVLARERGYRWGGWCGRAAGPVPARAVLLLRHAPRCAVRPGGRAGLQAGAGAHARGAVPGAGVPPRPRRVYDAVNSGEVVIARLRL